MTTRKRPPPPLLPPHTGTTPLLESWYAEFEREAYSTPGISGVGGGVRRSIPRHATRACPPFTIDRR